MPSVDVEIRQLEPRGLGGRRVAERRAEREDTRRRAAVALPLHGAGDHLLGERVPRGAALADHDRVDVSNRTPRITGGRALVSPELAPHVVPIRGDHDDQLLGGGDDGGCIRCSGCNGCNGCNGRASSRAARRMRRMSEFYGNPGIRTDALDAPAALDAPGGTRCTRRTRCTRVSDCATMCYMKARRGAGGCWEGSRGRCGEVRRRAWACASCGRTSACTWIA